MGRLDRHRTGCETGFERLQPHKFLVSVSINIVCIVVKLTSFDRDMSGIGIPAPDACPECEAALDESTDEVVCSECGLIVAEDWLDRGPEWRAFDESNRSRRRTGAPLTRSRHDRGLSTEIGHDASTRLTGRKRRLLTRLRRQHNRARISTKVERNRVYGFTEIRRLVAMLELPPSVREQGCVLFETAQNENIVRGRSLEGFAAAAVYATCRLLGFSRTRSEILDVARASHDEFKAAYDALNRELGLPIGPIDPREYVPRFASALGVPNEVERRATELVRSAHDAGLVNGRNPSGIAAACLYAAAVECEYELTQREAAAVADVSPVTVRATYRDLRE